jgi:hypothetical protein
MKWRRVLLTTCAGYSAPASGSGNHTGADGRASGEGGSEGKANYVLGDDPPQRRASAPRSSTLSEGRGGEA